MSKQPRKKLEGLVKAFVRSYHAEKRTQRIGSDYLPNREAIVEIIGQLRQLLFPGYFGNLALTEENLSFHMGDLLARLWPRLSEQIDHCLCFDHDGDDHPCRDKADEVTGEFLVRIPEIRRRLALDAQAAYDGDPAAKSIDEVIYCYPGFYAIMIYRLAHELVELGVPLMPRIMTEHAHSVTGTDIHPGAKIGDSFFIDHATGVVIGETARIGNNAKVYQGVTLGALSFPKDERGRAIKGLQRHPTIEDNVTIYANATILGGQTVIGRGSTVLGNVFITTSVEPHTIAGHKTPELELRKKTKRRKPQSASERK